MSNELLDLAQKVHDEKTFVQYLHVLIKDLEKTERECRPYPQHGCIEAGHWEARNTKDYLESMAEWGGGDFGDGHHGGDPILRRVATMLYVGRYKIRKSDERKEDEWDR